MSDGKEDQMDHEWQVVAMKPRVILLWAMAVASLGCFGLALLWTIQYFAYLTFEETLNSVLKLIAAGSGLGLMYFIGLYLDVKTK